MARLRVASDIDDPLRGLLPPRGPWRLRLRPWIVAPVLSIVAVVALYVEYEDREWETFDEARARLASTRLDETPLVLWAAAGDAGPVVAADPGAETLPGTWAVDSRGLAGSIALAPVDDGSASALWEGAATGGEQTVDGVVWRQYLRPGVPGDLDRLGHDARVTGTWLVRFSGIRCYEVSAVDLLPAGTCAREAHGTRRWASDGRVVVIAPERQRALLCVDALVACECPARAAGEDQAVAHPEAVACAFRAARAHGATAAEMTRPECWR